MEQTEQEKTSEAIRIVKEWRSERPYGIVVAFDPQFKLRAEGIVNYNIDGSEKDWAGILIQEKKNPDGTTKTNPKTGKPLYKFQNSLLIIDDYKSLLDGNHMPKSFLKLLALRMEISMDIIYITHSPKLILERLSYYTNHFSIFYSESEGSDFESKIPNHGLVQRASNVINKYVFSFGKGRWKDGWDEAKKQWINGRVVNEFPHAYINTEKGSIEGMNIHPVKFKLLQDNGMDEIKTKIEFKKLYPIDYHRAFPDEN